jgi:hypothetical protein
MGYFYVRLRRIYVALHARRSNFAVENFLYQALVFRFIKFCLKAATMGVLADQCISSHFGHFVLGSHARLNITYAKDEQVRACVQRRDKAQCSGTQGARGSMDLR